MTIKEIAKLAKVSVSTVSKVMNHKDESISPETRERVLQIAKDFNYTPYSGVLSPATRTFMIGVLLSAPNTGRVLDGILDAAQDNGYLVTASVTSGDYEAEQKAITALCRHRVDAVLWQPAGKKSLEFMKYFQDQNIPRLLLPSREMEGDCYIDYAYMGKEATSQLIHAGHWKIGILTVPGTYRPRFVDGCKKALFDAEIPFQDQMVFDGISEVLLSRISSGAITGIVISHYPAALDLYGILSQRHYRIPEDFSLISLREDRTDNITFPRLSCIDIPYYEFGKHVAENLINSLEHETNIHPFRPALHMEQDLSIGPPYTSCYKPITVIGSINIDNYLAVESLPVSGRSTVTTNLALYPGGKAINMAIGVSRLGATARVIGTIGNDMDTDIIFSSLKDHNVDASRIRRCPDCSTGKAFILVQPNGESTISLLTGANDLLVPEDVLNNPDAFKNIRYCLLQTEVPQAPLIQAARLAREHGAQTILKPSACSYLEPELLKYTDIIVPNLNELDALCPGKDFEEQMNYLLDAGISAVITTFGDKGCCLKTRDQEIYYPAAEFTAVDNTGASDAFISALTVYLQDGYPMDKAIRIATYAAGFCISREGVALSTIDRNTLESYVRKKEPGLLEL